MKRIMRFCKLTFMSSPLYFILNIICMLGFSLIQLGIKYSFKYASDTIISVQDSEVMSFSFAAPILLFFILIIIGGNTNNMTSMVSRYIRIKQKSFFPKRLCILLTRKGRTDITTTNF